MIDHVLLLIDSSKYALLFLGSYFEGSVAILTGGVLYRIGVVAFWPMYLSLFAADILADLTWYAIGYFGARRFFERYGKYVNLTPAVIEKAEDKFHTYHLRILVISKLTMGFGFATAILATAGMLRVSLMRFVVINVVAGIIWLSFLIGIGYYFGNILEHLPRSFQIGSVVAMIVVFFVVVRAISKYLAKAQWE